MEIKNSKLKIQNLGFTLIELLIVIALLGVLAIALLATIDPLEQLKKGQDTATRNVLQEFNSGALRYYASKGEFPWSGVAVSGDLDAAAVSVYVQTLIQAGELKTNFEDSRELPKITLSANGSAAGGSELTVCYQPQSKSFRDDANSYFNATGGSIASPACPNPTNTACYWCIAN